MQEKNKGQKIHKKVLVVPVGKFASDSFVCNKCGCRMILKIYGNETPCRQEGCNGTMYRVE